LSTPWERFKQAAGLQQPEQVPVAFIVDSPWLPGYAGINTLDYFLLPDKWLEINLGLLERFPDAVWIPGFWVEYGMVAEPSAFGAQFMFHADRPPSIRAVNGDPAYWATVTPRDPRQDGVMPLLLRLYEIMETRLQAQGLGIKMVAARGPLATAGFLMGVSELMTALTTHPDEVHRLLDAVTTTIVTWLYCQLETLRAPEGVLLLDDVVGMLSPRLYQAFAAPYLRRIFDAFAGLIRIYHNDTPCAHLYGAFSAANFDVFNFSHQADIAETKALMGQRVALMGNVAPLDIAVRESPAVVQQTALECLAKGAPGGGMILSFGGGVSMGTPAASLDAMLAAAREWGSGK